MSHIQGTDYVGSMVVLEDGLPKKCEYRRFKIKGEQGNDDFAAMEEVLTRRFTAYLDEPREAGRGPTAAASPTRRTCCWSTAARASSAWRCGCSRSWGSTRRSRRVAGQAVRGGVRAGPAEPVACPATPRRCTCCSASATRRTASPSPTTASCGGRDDDLGARRHPRPRAETRKTRLVKELGGVNKVKAASLEELRGLTWLPDNVADAVHRKIHAAPTWRG